VHKLPVLYNYEAHLRYSMFVFFSN